MSALPVSSAPTVRYLPPSIAGDYTELTPKQTTLLDIAARLGREKFAPRAQQIDRDAVFPFENYADLHESGYLRLAIPVEFGGEGVEVGLPHPFQALNNFKRLVRCQHGRDQQRIRIAFQL